MIPDLSAWTPADWTAAGGIGTFVVAAAATGIGWRQLKQARTLREEEAAPFVIVDVVPSPSSRMVLNLVIENIGKTVARDVRITFDPPVQSAMNMDGYELQDWAPLKDGIKTLAPGRRLTAMFDHGVQRYSSGLPRRYEVVVECMDARRRVQPRMEYTVDLEPLYGALHADAKGMHQLVQEIEKVHKDLERLTRQTMTVEVFDGPTERAKRVQRRDEQVRQIEAQRVRMAERQSSDEAHDAPAGEGEPGVQQQ